MNLIADRNIANRAVFDLRHIVGVARSGGQADTRDSLAALASGVAEEFRRNVVFIDSLSRTYGFRWECVLQPGLYTKAHITDEETSADRRALDPQLRTLFLDAYARIRAEHLPHLHDFTPVFDNHPATVYIDVCHVSEEGNAIIADSLAALMAH